MAKLSNREYAAKHSITVRQASKIRRHKYPFTQLTEQRRLTARNANKARLKALEGPSY